ncbi:MAG: diguanylate cyclase [Kofleriaceae bacterium]|nr:diguanylate cyclase [Myxococcales bacterium]MCB9562001.1 diguanylate cyclase [Kofleriaceae bacterium]
MDDDGMSGSTRRPPATAPGPAETLGAEALEVFLRFPSPLAIATTSGVTLLVNDAMTGQFGAVSPIPESVRALVRRDDDRGRVALRDDGEGGVVEVPARLVRLRDGVLLMIGGPPGEPGLDELASLRDRVSQLERLAATDHLTGAWNRSYFDRMIEAELARGVGGQHLVSLVLLDVDHFKRINDVHGHATGDAVLRELVRCVQARIRASDVLFRWGGEEFAVLAGSTGYRGAQRLAEHLCAAVAAHSFPGVGTVTVSLGVAEHQPGELPADWFARLDAALYAAKEAGRNRVVVDRRGKSDAFAGGRARSPLHLVWQEAYECGEPTIDDEHRDIFVLANRLIDAVAAARDAPEVFQAALDDLMAHVRQHFADEEAILFARRYPQLETHKRAHAGLLRRAEFLNAQAAAGEATLGAVVEFLAEDVVARHLMTVDRAFFPLFEHAGPA